MRILITRPLEDGKEIAARLAERGHEALLAPLLTPRFHDGPEPDSQRCRRPSWPPAPTASVPLSAARRSVTFSVFAVGPQTADEARKSGFTEVRNADGDAKALALAATLWARQEGCAAACLRRGCAGHSGGKPDRCAVSRCAAARSMPSSPRPACRRRREAALENRAAGRGDVLFAQERAHFRRPGRWSADGRSHGFLHQPGHRPGAFLMPFARIAIAARPNQAAMLALLG